MTSFWSYAARRRPAFTGKAVSGLLAELRVLWEDWNHDMLPLPADAVMPVSILS